MTRRRTALLASVLLLGACSGRSAPAAPVAATAPTAAARSAGPAVRPVARARPATCAVKRPPVDLPAKYQTPRVSAPGFPAVDTPFEQMKARARSTGKPAILYFCADWCGYCTKMNRETLSDPAVQRRIAEFPATLYDSGTPVGRAVANRYGIDAYPTMVLIDASGQEVDQIIGARPPAEFLAKLARH